MPGGAFLDDVVPEIREQRGGRRRRAATHVGVDGDVDRRGRRDRDRGAVAGGSGVARRKVVPEGAPTTGRPARSPARTSSSAAASSTDRVSGPAVERPFERGERRARDAPARRLQPEEPAAGGRDPDRAAAVGPVRGGDEARCQRSRGASARSAGRPLRVPRVARRAVELRLGEGGRPELRRVRLADDDEACVAEPANDGHVEVGDVVGERAGGVRRPDAGGRGEILDGDRDAAERARRPELVSIGAARSERLVCADRDERVELGSSRSMRSRQSSTSSVEETSPSRTSRACSTARGTRAPRRRSYSTDGKR